MKQLTILPALILSLANAVACPDCALKGTGGQIEPQTVVSKLAFSSSTLLMIGMVFAVVGFMLWIMVKTCRENSRDRALSSPSLEA
jgi:heme/copper-type cytochrome/quinol oxidase subunit 2